LKTLYCCKIRFDKLNIFLASSVKGAVRVGMDWADNNVHPVQYFKRYFPFYKLLLEESYNLPLIAEVRNVLLGGRDVKIPIDASFTPFQLRVMNAIRQIPFGQTLTYKDIALMISKPQAFRAVGQALRRNPLPLLFP